MKQFQSFKGHTGVYCIFHEEAGCAYVGQSTNIGQRIDNHLNDLRSGKHHNTGLQHLWSETGGAGFDWRLIEHAPKTLGGLTLERWLADREDSARVELGQNYRILNKAPSEVIESATAVKEFAQEVNEINRSITKERKRVALQAKAQEKFIKEVSEKLAHTQQRILQAKTTTRATTSLVRRILNLGPSQASLETVAKIRSLEAEHEALSEQLKRARATLQQLCSLSKALYAQYEGVRSRYRKRHRSIYDSPKPWETHLTRSRRKALYTPETRCSIQGFVWHTVIEVTIKVGESTMTDLRVDRLPWEIHCTEVVKLRVVGFAPHSSAEITVKHGEHLLMSEKVCGRENLLFEFNGAFLTGMRRDLSR